MHQSARFFLLLMSPTLLLVVVLAMLVLPEAISVTASIKMPVICERGCQTLTVTQFGVIPDDGRDDAEALNRLLDKANRNTIFYFPKGTYDLKSAIRQDGLNNVVFQGEPGALLRKMPGFQDEYLVYTRFSHAVAFRGLQFQGLTTDRNAYRWGESGLYLASGDGMLVEGNRFSDFGDAAIRVTTSKVGASGVTSYNTIVRRNVFDNVTQVSTTSNANEYGGSAGYLLEENTFSHLKGSVKFATRAPGAGQIVVQNNRISGVKTIPTSTGIEVASYSNVFLEDNQISDCGNFGINIYSNTAKDIRGFDWGHYLVQNNTIQNCPHGIRVSAQAYQDRYLPVVSDIMILNNRIRVADDKAIRLGGEPMQGVQMRGNTR
jgi:parallel beta-helix repeat protein